ncbi:MAG: transcription antitermination factor NusB [Cellulomonadaceae bacterium]|nr:transcription antitermination factor NusB [Cellulomonadaceae bacterium]
MGARTKARKRAADLLFEAGQRHLDPMNLLRDRLVEPHTEARIPQYAADIVEGVSAHRARIDELVETHSHGWTLNRMPSVDRALLTVGAWEILYNDDVADTTAIDEAVTLAARLSTDGSPAFVNALLQRIVDVKPMLVD